jgi:hypothetical protein
MIQQVHMRDLIQTVFPVHLETASRPNHFIPGKIAPSPNEDEAGEALEPTWTRLDRHILSAVGNRTTTRTSSPEPKHHDCTNTAPLIILLHAVF